MITLICNVAPCCSLFSPSFLPFANLQPECKYCVRNVQTVSIAHRLRGAMTPGVTSVGQDVEKSSPTPAGPSTASGAAPASASRAAPGSTAGWRTPPATRGTRDTQRATSTATEKLHIRNALIFAFFFLFNASCVALSVLPTRSKKMKLNERFLSTC